MPDEKKLFLEVFEKTPEAAFLRKNALSARSPHAFLLHGASTPALATIASWYAQQALCIEKRQASCTCASCAAARVGSHPDLLRVGADEALNIDAVRGLARDLSTRPFLSARKLAVVERVAEASVPAMHALLKTLEEPRAKAAIVITSPHVRNLPRTILSRSVVLRIRPVPFHLLQKLLPDVNLSQDAYDATAGDWWTMAEQLTSQQNEAIALADVIAASPAQRISTITRLLLRSSKGELLDQLAMSAHVALAVQSKTGASFLPSVRFIEALQRARADSQTNLGHSSFIQLLSCAL